MLYGRQSFRGLARRWGSSSLLVLLCAIGVALSTTIFAVVKTVLIDPLPYRDSDRLTVLWGVAESFGIDRYPFSWENYRDYRDRVTSLDALAAWRSVPMTLEGDERPTSINGARITPNFLDVLGIAPVMGSGFVDPADGGADAGVALIGHGLWQSQYGGAPDVVGRIIRLDGQPHEILGVMPPHLRYPRVDTQVFIPLRITEAPENVRAFHFLRLIGRRRADRTLEQTGTELRGVAEYLATTYPDASGELSIRALSLQEELVGSTRRSLGALFGGAQLLTLIAWANVAILLLARGMARRGELELREALGATRGRLLGLLLGEALALAGLGCALGLGIGWLAVSALPRIDPSLLPRAYELRFDAALVAWAVGLTLLGATLFGSLPALWATRSRSAGPAASRVTDRRTARLGARLVAAQVALALPLLVASGMQLRSVQALTRVELGYPIEGRLAAGVALPVSLFAPEDHEAFIERARHELGRIPGVESVGALSILPFSTRQASIVTFRPDQEGQPGLPNSQYRVISPGLLATLGIPLRAGREFEPADREADRARVVIDEELARTLWPDRDPIGRAVRLGTDPTHWEVIGVAASARLLALDQEPVYTIYVPVEQNRFPAALATPSFVLRSGVPAETLAPTVRDVLQQVDPRQAVLDVRPLAAQASDWLGDRRALARLLWGIAAAALILAAAGMYATLTFAVGRRLREMAIRSALGAGAAALAGRVVADGLKPGLLGAALGVGVCLAGSRLVAGYVYGIPAIDPPSLAGAVGLLLLAALLASGMPARRAVVESPATLLRQVEP